MTRTEHLGQFRSLQSIFLVLDHSVDRTNLPNQPVDVLKKRIQGGKPQNSTTSQGKVIGIFNEYAYLGKGSSIHSSGQLEWFKTNVDEKSVKVGGTQLITTLDGYSVPLLIKDGLAYATSLGKPTDQDMDTYPHVFFTSPDEWDPSVLDHDPPHLDGLDPSQVPDQPFGDPMFDA